MAKWVYSFGAGHNEGRADMRNLLGGKGANLAEMASIGLPVPPGFTVTTEVCTYYYAHQNTYPADLRAQVSDALALVEQAVAFVQRLRREDLGKTPGVAETLDWVRALHRLNWRELADDPAAIVATLGCLLKTREDRFQMGPERVLQLVEGRRSVGVAEKVAA